MKQGVPIPAAVPIYYKDSMPAETWNGRKATSSRLSHRRLLLHRSFQCEGAQQQAPHPNLPRHPALLALDEAADAHEVIFKSRTSLILGAQKKLYSTETGLSHCFIDG